MEVSVSPNGLAIACSNHYLGRISDFEIIQRRIEVHKKCLRKKERDGNIRDDGLHFDNYPNEWAILADKGYQGLQEIRRVVIPVNRPLRGILSM